MREGMRKRKVLILIIIILAACTFYYFFIHVRYTKTQQFHKFIDDYIQSAKPLERHQFERELFDLSDFGYYRHACEFEIEEIENAMILRNVRCDPEKVKDLLSVVPTDDLVKQSLFMRLSWDNGMKSLADYFAKIVKGDARFTGAGIVSFLVLNRGYVEVYSFVGGMISRCMQFHNKSLNCVPQIVETESKAIWDLVEDIEFGEDFVHECEKAKILSSMPLPPEVHNSFTRENCQTISEIYQDVFDHFRNAEMDTNGKFMILATLHWISNSFRGFDRERETEYIVGMLKKHMDPEFSDMLELAKS